MARPSLAFPFLTLPQHAVRLGAFMVGDPGEPLSPLEGSVDNWDYARDLEIHTDLAVDFDVASEALQIPINELKLAVSLEFGTGKGKHPARTQQLVRSELSAEKQKADLSWSVSGSGLSERLQLKLQILLAQAPETASPLSPRQLGARLWSWQHDAQLEDNGLAKFPMEFVSFEASFRDTTYKRGSWFYHWSPVDLYEDFGTHTRLYVNSDIPELVKDVTNANRFTVQAIMADIMSQTITSVLLSRISEETLRNCPEGTVGNQIYHWLSLAFPDKPLKFVLTQLSRQPGEFQAAILAAADLGEAP